MVFTGRKKYWFTPLIDGNEDLSNDEQLQVELIRQTAGDSKKLMSSSVVLLEDGSKRIDVSFDTKSILENHVGEIKNLIVEEDGKETVISNGKELSRASFYGAGALVNAICAELTTDKLSDDQKKILK